MSKEGVRVAGVLNRARKSLTLRQREVLDAIWCIYDETTQPIGPTELAAELGVSKTSALELLIRLTEAGHIKSRWVGRVRRFVPAGLPSPVANAIRLLKQHQEFEAAVSLEHSFS